jgi:hypothetical protein
LSLSKRPPIKDSPATSKLNVRSYSIDNTRLKRSNSKESFATSKCVKPTKRGESTRKNNNKPIWRGSKSKGKRNKTNGRSNVSRRY